MTNPDLHASLLELLEGAADHLQAITLQVIRDRLDLASPSLDRLFARLARLRDRINLRRLEGDGPGTGQGGT